MSKCCIILFIFGIGCSSYCEDDIRRNQNEPSGRLVMLRL